MNRGQFKTMCKLLGDQSLPENERWKSIVHLKYDNNSTIPYMERLVEQDKVAFVDMVTTVDTKEVILCGFILLETLPADTRLIPMTGNAEYGEAVTFINVDWVLGATFRNGPKGDQYTSMSDLAELFV